MTDRADEIPDHIVEVFGSARKFKEAKRRAIREALKGLEEFQQGCFYAPGFELFDQARDNLEEVQRLVSQKEWGR